jgi:hypothetical protein
MTGSVTRCTVRALSATCRAEEGCLWLDRYRLVGAAAPSSEFGVDATVCLAYPYAPFEADANPR